MNRTVIAALLLLSLITSCATRPAAAYSAQNAASTTDGSQSNSPDGSVAHKLPTLTNTSGTVKAVKTVSE